MTGRELEAAEPRRASDVVAFGQEVGRVLSDGTIARWLAARGVVGEVVVEGAG